MSGIYKVSQSELQFIQIFEEIPVLRGFESLEVLKNEKVLLNAADQLQRKQYLLKNDQNEYYLDGELKFLLEIVKNAFGYFEIENCVKEKEIKEVIYFLNDSIVSIVQNGGNYEIMWIPVLPLVIGQMAGFLSPFLNAESKVYRQCFVDEWDAVMHDYSEKNYDKQWQFSAVEQDAANGDQCCILSNGKKQVMLSSTGNILTISQPDKEDYINALTKMFAPIHGHAIAAGGMMDGRI